MQVIRIPLQKMAGLLYTEMIEINENSLPGITSELAIEIVKMNPDVAGQFITADFTIEILMEKGDRLLDTGLTDAWTLNRKWSRIDSLIEIGG